LQAPAPPGGIEGALLVARRQPLAFGHQPVLQQVHGLGARGVALAVQHAGAGGHALQLARGDGRVVAERALVPQRALQDPVDDLHVAVAVGLEAAAGSDAVLVDHAQGAETVVRRVEVLAEGEAVPAVEPVDFSAAALGRGPEGEHGGGR
jgi:hypothetical protein